MDAFFIASAYFDKYLEGKAGFERESMIANRERMEFHGVPVRVRKQGIPAGCDWVAVFKNGSMIGSNGFTAPPGSAKITAHRLPRV